MQLCAVICSCVQLYAVVCSCMQLCAVFSIPVLHGQICGSLSCCQSPLLVFSECKRAIDNYRHILQTMSLIIARIVFALIITINISCTAVDR